jgi:hypothetical protein
VRVAAVRAATHSREQAEAHRYLCPAGWDTEAAATDFIAEWPPV